jgi:ubiquinone/menaquinone biosynthesis C-methylase UbiE
MPVEYLSKEAIAAHDRQRQLSEEAQRALISGLCTQLAGRGLCLDAGVGTGSVALPLIRVGVPLVGIDISRAMLAALRAKSDGRVPFPLVQGDVTRLPFRDWTFGAVLAANLFHLIPDWREAVAEIARVLQPGGLLLVNFGGGGGTGQGGRILTKFREYLGGEYTLEGEAAGLQKVEDFDQCLVRYSAATLAPLEVRSRQAWTVEQAIDRLEHNVFAWPGGIDQTALHRAAATTRAWAREHLGPLDEPHLSERTITYRIYQIHNTARDTDADGAITRGLG